MLGRVVAVLLPMVQAMEEREEEAGEGEGVL